jgi:hypothetical protein
LGAAAFLGVGIGQLERAGLGCQAKNTTLFSRSSRERLRRMICNVRMIEIA